MGSGLESALGNFGLIWERNPTRKGARVMHTLSEAEFPILSRPIEWGVVRAEFLLAQQFDERYVSNVSIIPVMGDRYVVFQVENGMWELPGGTLEYGERYMEALEREVMEELGGKLLSYHVFGRFDCRSSAEKPYKPHLPFPYFIRLVGYGEVELVGKPLNPEGGEQVIAVDAVTIDEALDRFQRTGRQDIAELYKLAHRIRSQG